MQMHSSSIQKSKTILVVDDNGINRLLPGLILRPFGWEVYEADGGKAALKILKKNNIDCLLLDISMPEISGLDVLEDVRGDERFRSLKVVAYTAFAKPEDVVRLLALGFDAVLIKPLTSIKLLEVFKTS
jgi:two-component system, cell cycle response regulator DivK